MKKLLITFFLVMILASNVVAGPIVLKYAQFEPSNEAFAMKAIWLPWVKKMNELGESGVGVVGAGRFFLLFLCGFLFLPGLVGFGLFALGGEGKQASA